MTTRKKLVRKDVIRIARQKLWTDIGKALDSYEKHIYGDRALTSSRKSIPVTDPNLDAPDGAEIPIGAHGRFKRVGDQWEPIAEREGDITSVEEIERILPPEPPKKRGARAKRSPVSDHIHGESTGFRVTIDTSAPRQVPNIAATVNSYGLSATEEKVLIFIVQSAGGMTSAQLAIKVATIKKRTIQNVLSQAKLSRRSNRRRTYENSRGAEKWINRLKVSRSPARTTANNRGRATSFAKHAARSTSARA